MAPTDLDIPLLRRRLSGRLLGCQVLYHDSLDSTMDEARRLAEQGEPEGTVVISEEQTSGRGRFHRSWITPRGQNLNLSVLLRPTLAQLPYVNMASTMAVCRAVQDLTGLAPAIKWPNDVRVNGRKLAGILIETAVEGAELTRTIVGIGLNVNFDPAQYPEIASFATSMSRETGQSIDRTPVLQIVLEQLDGLYREVEAGRSLTSDWAALLETLGRTVQVSWNDRVVEGRAESVDEQGNLILARPDGTTFTALAGEVTLQV